MRRQPTWDLAQAGRHVPRREGGRRTRRPALLFPRIWRKPASKWVGDPEALARLMTRVSFQGGYIRKVLTHARRESMREKVSAVVYVGDCMEEDIDELSQRAASLDCSEYSWLISQEETDVETGGLSRRATRRNV